MTAYPPLPRNGQGERYAVEFRGVTKLFHIYEHGAKSLRELFVKTVGRGSPRTAEPLFRLSEVSFGVRAGETWALVGPNGAGKTTMLRLMGGIYWPSAGEVITRGPSGHGDGVGCGLPSRTHRARERADVLGDSRPGKG